MPGSIEEWAVKHENREVAIAALTLIRKSGDKDTVRILADIARTPGQDPVRVTAALDAMAELSDSSNLGYALGLLTSNASGQVTQHAGVSARIVAAATASHLKPLLDLMDNQLAPVRALAMEALGGPGMMIVDGPEAAKTRQELGARIAAKIDPDAQPEQLAAALRAARGLRLNGARDAVLALVPKIESLALPGIDAAFMSDLLGARFIFKEPAEARAASDDLVAKLTVALDDPASRTIAADALGKVGDAGLLHLRLALDKLAALGEDPACFNALAIEFLGG
jgi:hypothetical protein